MTDASHSAPFARRRALLLLFGLCLATRAVSLVRPCLSDDEATYCVVAREMLSGHVLYRDVVDHKPPLIYLTYAATQAIGGPIDGMRFLHLLTILVVFATALWLARIARRHGGLDEATAFGAALLYVVFTSTLLDFDALAANCELFMLLPLTASVDLFLASAGEARTAGLLGSGALVGLAMLYKYQGGIQLPLYGAYLLVVHRGRLRRAFAGGLLVALGALALLGGAAGLMALDGSLRGAIFWFRFNFSYIREGLALGELARRIAIRVSFVVASALLLYLLGLRAALRLILRRRPAAAEAKSATIGFGGFCVGWLLVSALAISVGGRFFGHYFHQLTAPLAVLAAPGLAALWRRRRTLVTFALALPALGFFLVGLCHERLMALAGHPDPPYRAMAAFLDAHSGPRDPLVIWGNSPLLYFWADRPLGSRFVFSNYLSGLSPATRTQSDPRADASANVVPESWAMLDADLASRKPLLFVDASPGNVADYGKFPPARFPRLAAILERDYEPIALLDGVRVSRRRSPGLAVTR